MSDSHWTTKLSYTTEDGIVIRGYDLIQLIGVVPFPSVLYLLFTGELPQPKTAKLIDALMVACIDHGPGAPSVLAARTAASGGAPLGAAAAAGLLTLNKFHGAAVEDSMESIQRVFALSNGQADQLDRAADTMVAEWRQAGRRIAGFGHRQHKITDPRLERLFELAREAEVPGVHLEAARAIVRALKRSTGKDLPINIDGATAALLCEINFPITLSNALFMVARITGILAHANEEITQMPPMRRIDPVDHGYDGPPARNLPSKH
ncbi:MAG TPA: citryl-CoA lyase [Anaerolineales bacterium]|nr:citryl-CoA lyase [Anaerolineales bacterium]